MKHVALLIPIILAGCSASTSAPPPIAHASPVSEPDIVVRPRGPELPKSITVRNVIFTPQPESPLRPRAQSLELPILPTASAVWGSTGRDEHGHIYFGVSTEGEGELSARLVDHDPHKDTTSERGNVLAQLRRLGLARPGENQNKIHTKIWQAPDGWLHFASMDEGGENEDGTRLPTFGSHIWRVRPGSDQWEHLEAVPEALIASAPGGNFIYYLGYFGHVLYQWNVESGRLTGRVRVGAVGGHTTRNIVADSRGHVFVPRVVSGKAELVEFDETLREVAAFPLTDYSLTPDSSSHGIVSWTPLADGGAAFVTDRGRLYRLIPRSTGTAIIDLGYLHPDGPSYTASLFTFDGESSVVGIGHRQNSGDARYEWIAYDLRLRRGAAEEVRIPSRGNGVLLYGSITRDDRGRLYLAGRAMIGDQSIPMAWSIVP